jgi:hypothetical protein
MYLFPSRSFTHNPGAEASEEEEEEEDEDEKDEKEEKEGGGTCAGTLTKEAEVVRGLSLSLIALLPSPRNMATGEMK